ncbi:hypothetical protein ABER99_21750 [Paenibacillus glucanolyticus]|uniref:Uncharacterized protein n=2 Tax=Paenibacillus TaxID=44249 RepID=A0A163GR11_9BACL|nr:hypothetical protein [Paenibacillus glucanolyticus]KZS45102.1 hypothetical protein AWU65_03730 [Paenibacillus glucanolyticus]OMF65477.1 hypothetical protein BK142_30765 [Paenibacillus glucanolyticus]
MLKQDDVLINPVDFDNAIFFALPIEVYMKEGTHQETGVIESHTENKITINGGYYLKETCIFKVGYLPNGNRR